MGGGVASFLLVSSIGDYHVREGYSCHSRNLHSARATIRRARGEATKMLPATVLVAYLKNKKYIDERYTHLLPRYDGKYIAVRDGRVVAAAPTIEALRTEFARASITPLDEETAVAFITSDTASMLL